MAPISATAMATPIYDGETGKLGTVVFSVIAASGVVDQLSPVLNGASTSQAVDIVSKTRYRFLV
jgi:hypothetical protein